MYIAFKIVNTDDSAQNGWFIYHLRPIGNDDQQVTLLGFASNDNEATWSKLRGCLPGVTWTGDATVTAEQFRRYQATEETPDHMRRVADAVEGN